MKKTLLTLALVASSPFILIKTAEAKGYKSSKPTLVGWYTEYKTVIWFFGGFFIGLIVAEILKEQKEKDKEEE